MNPLERTCFQDIDTLVGLRVTVPEKIYGAIEVYYGGRELLREVYSRVEDLLDSGLVFQLEETLK